MCHSSFIGLRTGDEPNTFKEDSAKKNDKQCEHVQYRHIDRYTGTEIEKINHFGIFVLLTAQLLHQFYILPF